MKSVKRNLLIGTLLSSAMLVTTAPAFAQDSDDELIVTGSRILRQDLDTASPITVLDREDLIVSGITDVGDLIQTIPSMSGSPIGTTTNNGGNGSVRVDLRGLGSARTLTLVNGQRMVDQGDFQTIPSTLIKRVDILKDGASAVYGADAVAGVVNIITRNDFDGIELTGQYNLWDKTSNGEQYTLGFLGGKTFEEGNFVFGAEYVDQKAIYQRDTPWDFFQDSYYIYPEGCEAQVTAPYDGSATSGCYPIGSSRIPESRLGFASQGTFLVGTPATGPNEVGLIIPHDGRNYNYAPVNFIQTPYNKLNIFTEGRFDVTDDVEFNFQLRGSKRNSSQELAPLPFNSPTDPAYSGFYDIDNDGDLESYSGISEFNYYLREGVDNYNATNGLVAGDAGFLEYEPVIDARRRMIETTRRFEQEVDQVQLVAGLKGEFNNINWDVYANHGYRKRTDVDYGQFSGPALQAALGPSADLDGDGNPECYADTGYTQLIAGCVPLNFFGGGSVVRETGEITASTLTEEMVNYVSTDLVDKYKDELTALGGSITGSLPVSEMFAGDIGWALGAGYYERSFAYTPDSSKAQDAVTGNTGASTDGTIENYHLFAELAVPVFDNGVQSFDLNGGLRYDKFSGIDENVTWQLGAEFQALESLKLRGTAGSVFRVPTVSNLFGGLVDSFPTYVDPCAAATPAAGCAQASVQLDSQILAKVGGNPNLKPETGDTLTLGAVFTPDLGDHNVSVTLDYFNVKLQNGISTLGVQEILNQCYVGQVAEACALVTRRPDYSIAQILDAALNLTEQNVEGIDTEVRWDKSYGFGDLNASFIWTHLIERSFIPFPGEDLYDATGQYLGNQSGAGYPKDKFNYSVGWGRDGFKVTYRGEFVGPMDAETFCNCGAGNQPDGSYLQAIDSQLYHDITVSYNAEEYGATISAGVTNLTNEEPPFIETGFNAGTEPAIYRVLGRGFYARVTKTF